LWIARTQQTAKGRIEFNENEFNLRDLIKGIILINLLVFGVCFVVMLIFTFPPPIIVTGLIFLTLFVAYVLAPRDQRA